MMGWVPMSSDPYSISHGQNEVQSCWAGGQQADALTYRGCNTLFCTDKPVHCHSNQTVHHEAAVPLPNETTHAD